MAETSHSDADFDAWEADGWQLPDGVQAAFGGPRSLTVHATGRRKPITGTLRRVAGDGIAYAPDNRNGRRHEDRALLDRVAEVVGLGSVIPPNGRPAGRGLTADLVPFVDSRPEGVSFNEAIRRAAEALGSAEDSTLRQYRRAKARDQREVPAAADSSDEPATRTNGQRSVGQRAVTSDTQAQRT